MKTTLAILAISAFVSNFVAGCAKDTRVQNASVQTREIRSGSGTNYVSTINQPVLLDGKTGKMWVYRWDAQKRLWQTVPITNAPVFKSP